MTFPVVSADSDHRLLSLEPFGLRLGQSAILMPSQSLTLGLTLTAATQLVEGHEPLAQREREKKELNDFSYPGTNR